MARGFCASNEKVLDVSKDTNTPQLKAGYARPELTVFGSVRNLTGGSSSQARDDTGNMMNMN